MFFVAAVVAFPRSVNVIWEGVGDDEEKEEGEDEEDREREEEKKDKKEKKE